MKDYIVYIHTDSLMTRVYEWLKDNGVTDNQWNNISIEQQIDYIKKIAKQIENYVNDRSYKETQLSHYNSQEHNLKTFFEQEKIALSGVFKDKGRYATWTLLDGGNWKDEMSVTGLEIIRSDSPEMVKPRIKKILEMLLKDYKDDDIRKYINKCKKELKQCSPEEIAENKGINKTDIYIYDNYKCKKGTPHQLKGVANFKYLLNKYNLSSEYEIPQNGNKAKVVYVKKNPFKIESLSFLTWPKEFDNIGIEVDYNKMIINNFTSKVKNLLKTVDKEYLLEENMSIGSFFK